VKTLEAFLNENIEKGHCEFRLVAKQRDKYTTSFYIHCLGHDSATLDFEVDKNILSPDSTITRPGEPAPKPEVRSCETCWSGPKYCGETSCKHTIGDSPYPFWTPAESGNELNTANERKEN
jgi:hypothetical protein